MRTWTEADVLYWWRLGKDTQQIAEILNRGSFKSKGYYRGKIVQKPATESEVYNTLHWAREQLRLKRRRTA